MTRSQAQESARKVCSPNRELYRLQSAMTRNGYVPSMDEVRQYEREQMETASPTEESYEH